ncbi:MAG: sensor histidine kinase [Candidatus Brocadiia bacterium]
MTLGIRAKIVLPFAGLFVAVTLVAALFAARATARVVDQRVQAQMSDLAAVLSQAGFAFNRNVLEKVKTIVGGELATVDAGGAVQASTLGRDAEQALSQVLAAQAPPEAAGTALRSVRLGGESYRAAVAPVGPPPGREGQAFLYRLSPEAEIEAATRAATRPILVAAACGAAAAVVFGILVGGAIARPVQSLAAQARRLAAGGGGERLEVRTRDEVGRLAEAFNSLLDSLRQAEARVVASERLAAVGQVAAGIAHEVRNPLSGIKMSAQLLGRRLRELGAEDESVGVMLGEIARLEVIIDDLLTFAGPARLSPEPTDLNAAVREVLDFMARQLEHAGVAVRRELDEGLPLASIDPRRIRQVVLNLVLNAAEAMPRGGTLTVRTRAAEGAVVGEVADTGQGIAPEHAERIFDPFFTTKKGGSGLGLGVSRTLVEAHGGTLGFEPADGGTCFRFALPIEGPPEGATESGQGGDAADAQP